jgi:hypothetical protein
VKIVFTRRQKHGRKEVTLSIADDTTVLAFEIMTRQLGLHRYKVKEVILGARDA